MGTMADAFEKAGLKPAHQANNNNRAPRKWWQICRLTLTKFEVPTVLVVECDEVREGLEFIRNRKLNSLAPKAKTFTEARTEIFNALSAWQGENLRGDDVVLPKGGLHYFQTYGETFTPRFNQALVAEVVETPNG